LIEKATHVTLLWHLSRNPDKISSKIRRKNSKNTKFDETNDKNRKFNYSIAKNVDEFWLKF
jgi:hypothetical protein